MLLPRLFRRPTSSNQNPNQGTPETVPATPQNSLRQLQIGSRLLEYRLQRSQRASIGFLINDEGLRVSAPLRASIADIEHALVSKQRWIFGKLDLRAAHAAAKPSAEFVWQDGAQIPYLGRSISLRIQLGKAMPALLNPEANTLVLGLSREANPDKIRQRVHTWLQAQAEHEFSQRLQHFAAKMGVTYTQLVLSSARTQWGSCSSQGVIRLNWRLIHFHPGLIDYVVIHELAHRKEMNHSPRFWALVEQQMLSYKEAREQLQKASRALPQGL